MTGSFESLLFPDGRDPCPADESPLLRDLNFDAIVEAVLAGRDEYRLAAFCSAPLASVDEVAYRHEVFRDLERDEVRGAVVAFAETARRVRRQLELARKQQHALEKQRWFLDAAALYAAAVTALRDALSGIELGSRALRELRSFLDAYTAADDFRSLAAEARDVLERLDGVRYTVRIKGTRVTVGEYEEGADYSAEIAETFARFRQRAVEDQLVLPPDSGSMDTVEAQIAQLVQKLYPDAFAALAAFCRNRRGFFDATVARFEREAQFYLAWLDQVELLRETGLPFCYPTVTADSNEERVEHSFDLALALTLAEAGSPVVRNGYELRGAERILVVSGPNQGGKTTFARMVGQLHQLARLGVPVPGERARLRLVDEIYTHFEREEDLATLHGKLDDELARVKEILERASGESLVILNEIFASTSLADAALLGTDLLTELVERDCVGVCVTFIDELAALGDATVSMVATVQPDDPSQRTFRIVRKPADGRAYASALAEKYGLSYERLRSRVAG